MRCLGVSKTQTTDLENEDLEDADLENADLENADLENADLENAYFSQTQDPSYKWFRDSENGDHENSLISIYKVELWPFVSSPFLFLPPIIRLRDPRKLK